MDNKFFEFAKPYLSYIDNGSLYRRPFSWLYALIAIINLILPLYVLFLATSNDIFDAPAKFSFTFLLTWISIAFACWISFQLWWDRKSKVISTSTEKDEFVATPVFSHFIQTMGEWLGTLIGIVGFSVALFTTLILGDEAYYITRQVGLGFMQTGLVFIILMPIYGFLIIVASRFLAEQFRALASVANNTRKN